MQEPWIRAIEYFLPYKGRIMGTVLGLVIGTLVITIGWLKAIYFLLCVAVGYFLGKRADAKENLFQMVRKIFSSNGHR